MNDLDGLLFCVNKELLKTVKSVSIDLTYMGFAVEPEVPFARGGGSSCGSSCGGCGA